MAYDTSSQSNKNPEQIARDKIDAMLENAGWIVQDRKRINLNAGIGVALREYPTDVGPADYALFVDGEALGILEAKREEEGHHLVVHEDQAEGYGAAELKYIKKKDLPFIYISTGTITRFIDHRDPKPQTREIFSFHRPETLRDWARQTQSLRRSLKNLNPLKPEGLRTCQFEAITSLEKSFKKAYPKALITMATGAGKTFTAITAVYRLLSQTNVKRVLFLVDTRNLGRQAEQEFSAYVPADDNRKFTELYGVCRLTSRYIPDDCQVYISTIQRLYALLKGQELDETAEDENPNETVWRPRTIPPIEYNAKLPVEFFDVIIIDECHRSIYNLWKQVLDYFDAFQVGLTATPDARTFAYFQQNVVSEYSHEMSVADGVNVGYDTFLIETKISRSGATIWKGHYIEKRERLTRRKRFELQDEDETYSAKELDRSVVNPSQIRTIIREVKNQLPSLFPDRCDSEGNFEVPKTLIFAKTDSHADDIIKVVREEFSEENKFCKKMTYKAEEDTDTLLSQFRNDYYPRIAVTVDMIATGTDVKPLEVLVFMRDVGSSNYFEQMKGRGTRTISFDDLKKVSPAAKFAKDHFVIIDAVGVSTRKKTNSRPLEQKPNVPLKDLLNALAVGQKGEELFTSVAGRLARLDKQLTDAERSRIEEVSGGVSIPEIVRKLLNAYNPDSTENLSSDAVEALRRDAARVFTGEFNELVEGIRRSREQIIDTQNIDAVINSGLEKDHKEKAKALIGEFRDWLESHKNEIGALQIFYSQPYRRRELTLKMLREVVDIIASERPKFLPFNVWKAYEALGNAPECPKSELIALVSLIREITGIDQQLTPFAKTVDANFQKWIFGKNNEQGRTPFTPEQYEWLKMIKDHIAASAHLDVEDLDYTPFDTQGGRGRMFRLFGDSMFPLIAELNEALSA